MMKHSKEFKQEAVRIALTSGLSRERVAKDLGIGKSTLGKWLAQYRPADLISAPQADLARENERLRLENRVLKEERDILKKAPNASGSSSRASGREVCIRGELAPHLSSRDDLPGDADQHAGLSLVAHATSQPAFPHGHGSAGPHSGAV
jgi:transposase